jgi:orotate phosphoribosyltransferase
MAGLRLDFLHAHTIWRSGRRPFDKALAGRRTDAVEIERDQPESQEELLFVMSTAADPRLAQEFVEFAVQAGVLRFGAFTTKAGRLSPYFFNAGLFCDGARLGRLAEFYARRLLADSTGGDLGFDMIFGPAYKGITLAAAVAVELAGRGHNLPFAYNRKEAKDHGEGGLLVGAPLAGRVLIIDDVISAGTSVREAIAMIASAGARPAAVDRQERATEAGHDAPCSAVQYVTRELHLRVSAIATLADLLDYLRGAQDPSMAAHAEPVAAYRDRYGV